MNRLLAFAAIAATALLAVAAFVPTAYLGLKAFPRGLSAEDARAGALILLVILLAAGVVEWISQRVRAWRGAAARAAESRRRLAASDRLARDPRWAHFAPLIRSRQIADEKIVASWDRRYRELLADPKRRRHAARVLNGDNPTNRQIDYEDDPRMLVTCPHLRPIERDLRAKGHRNQPTGGAPSISTDARLDFAALRAAYALPDFVERYDESPFPRADPEAFLLCVQCRSSIGSGHGAPFPPRESGARRSDQSASI